MVCSDDLCNDGQFSKVKTYPAQTKVTPVQCYEGIIEDKDFQKRFEKLSIKKKCDYCIWSEFNIPSSMEYACINRGLDK